MSIKELAMKDFGFTREILHEQYSEMYRLFVDNFYDEAVEDIDFGMTPYSFWFILEGIRYISIVLDNPEESYYGLQKAHKPIVTLKASDL